MIAELKAAKELIRTQDERITELEDELTKAKLAFADATIKQFSSQQSTLHATPPSRSGQTSYAKVTSGHAAPTLVAKLAECTTGSHPPSSHHQSSHPLRFDCQWLYDGWLDCSTHYGWLDGSPPTTMGGLIALRHGCQTGFLCHLSADVRSRWVPLKRHDALAGQHGGSNTDGGYDCHILSK